MHDAASELGSVRAIIESDTATARDSTTKLPSNKVNQFSSLFLMLKIGA